MPDHRTDPSATPAVTVIGCSTISQAFHIPTLARHAELRERFVPVDPDLGRAREMAERFGVPAAGHGEVLGEVAG